MHIYVSVRARVRVYASMSARVFGMLREVRAGLLREGRCVECRVWARVGFGTVV